MITRVCAAAAGGPACHLSLCSMQSRRAPRVPDLAEQSARQRQRARASASQEPHRPADTASSAAKAARHPLLDPSGPGSAHQCAEVRTSLSVRMRSCSAAASAPSTPATTTTSGRSAAGRSRRSSPPAAEPACDRRGPRSCHHSLSLEGRPAFRVSISERSDASCDLTAKQIAHTACHAATHTPHSIRTG